MKILSSHMKINTFFVVMFVILSIKIHAALSNNLSAYNEVVGVQPTAQIQLQYPYLVNADYVTTSTTGTGSVSSTVPFAVLSSGAAAGTVTLASNARLHYYPGEGATTIFSAIFSTGLANTTQYIGVGNSQDGFFFGYNGATFGILHRVNSVDTDFVAQSSWNGDIMNGSGTSGKTLVQTNGNIYKIQYHWLGFGVVKFFVENQDDGSWILVHTFKFPNSQTATSLLNASLQLYATVTSTVAAPTLSLQTSCMSGLIEGYVNTDISTRNSISVIGNNALTPVSGAGSSSTYANILTIRNNTTFGGIPNQVMIYLNELSILNGQASTNAAYYTIFLDVTVGGTPTFVNINANTSVVSYDRVGTTINYTVGGSPTVSPGKELMTFYLPASAAGETLSLDLSDFNIVLMPGDTLTIAGKSAVPGGTIAATNERVTLSWTERF